MDFQYFEKMVLKDFGINLAAYKSTQLHRRLLSLMSRVGVSTAEEYIQLLNKDSAQRQKFLDFITINVTEFFRNPEIFDELKQLLERKVIPQNNSMKIWSAACSIGAEPYSLAMILDELTPHGNHKILATDIDNTCLMRAKAGEYVAAEIKNINEQQLAKYFTEKNGKYTASPKLKSMITFKKHDLILGEYEKEFDLIVCRNVVIYFTQEVKDEIYLRFSNSLKKGGLLFVGATESIYNYKEYGFEKCSTFIYRKI